MLIPNLLAALAQERPRMLALRIRVLAPRWFQDVPESLFSEFLGMAMKRTEFPPFPCALWYGVRGARS